MSADVVTGLDIVDRGPAGPKANKARLDAIKAEQRMMALAAGQPVEELKKEDDIQGNDIATSITSAPTSRSETRMAASAAPVDPVIVIEDNKVPVELGYCLSEKSIFSVSFLARKVELTEESISILLDDIVSFKLPLVPAKLQLTVNGQKFDVSYAGGMMRFGQRFRIVYFVVA